MAPVMASSTVQNVQNLQISKQTEPKISMTSTTKSNNGFVSVNQPRKTRSPNLSGMNSQTNVSTNTFLSIQRDPRHIRAQNVVIDDMLSRTLFNTRKSLKSVSQPSLYNRTLDNESASMTMFNASKIDVNCRGYVTRKGLKRKRPANAPDVSNLSMDATIKSLDRNAYINQMTHTYSGTHNNFAPQTFRNQNGFQNRQVFFANGMISDNNLRYQNYQYQTIHRQIQQSIKKPSLDQMLNKLYAVTDPAIMNQTVDADFENDLDETKHQEAVEDQKVFAENNQKERAIPSSSEIGTSESNLKQPETVK